jgi:hypothetical protein
MSEIELINLVASSERTPQLAEYWTKRYKKFLKEKLFVISDKTKGLLVQTEVVSSPTTPFGHIDMLRFVNKNKGLEEVALQNSVETAIRFLDSCLDTINFGEDAHQIVIEFRKIGLGVIGFEEYLIAKNATSKEDEINYVGNIISGSAYRASEALAEEKGVCGKWNSIKIMLRPKPYEFWYDTVNGDIKNGLELMEEFDVENISESNFEIIPRRNSHMLLYPIESSWQLWSDRDEATTPKSKVTFVDKEKATAKISKSEINELSSDKSFEPSFDEKKEKGLESARKLSGFSSIINSGKKVVHEWFKDDEKADEIIGNNLNRSVGKIDSMLESNSVEEASFEKPKFTTVIETKKTSDSDLAKFAFPKNDKIISAPLTSFTINDIVKVINKKSELFGNIFQIHDLEYDQETSAYLVTLESKDGIIVRDSEIEKISIEELLTDSKKLPEITVSGVIFSQDGQKVALQSDSKLLPQINKCTTKESLDSQLLASLKDKYNLVPELTDISGIVVKQNKIIISYILTIASDAIDQSLGWFGLHEVYDDESRTLVTASIEKTKKLQNTIRSKSSQLLKEKLTEQTKVSESDYQFKFETEKNNVIQSVKSQFESQVKDLKYKLQEKTKELFDYQEVAKVERSILDSKVKELENSKESSLKQAVNDFEVEITDLHNQIAASKLKVKEMENSKESSLKQAVNDFEVEITDLHNQIAASKLKIDEDNSKNEVLSKKIAALKEELENLTAANGDEIAKYQQKIEELNIVLKSKEGEIKNISALKEELENLTAANGDELAKYQQKIEELNIVLKSKEGEIKNIYAAKDNELKLALDEQSKVRLDLEQMCLARIEQQKESQLQYEKSLASRFENQSQVLAAKYDADIKKHEEELRVILSKREGEYKINLNRQKQYYEDLIKKIGFASAESFDPSPKPVKIKVEEVSEKDYSKVINHSYDEIFQQTRDNLFKPNLPQNTPIITEVASNELPVITHTSMSKNITNKDDTLKTLLKMKGIVARK